MTEKNLFSLKSSTGHLTIILKYFLMMQRYSLKSGLGVALHDVTKPEMQRNPTQWRCSLGVPNNQPGAGTRQDSIRFPHCPRLSLLPHTNTILKVPNLKKKIRFASVAC